MALITLMLALGAGQAAAADAFTQETPLFSFDRDAPPEGMVRHDTRAELTEFEGRKVLQVDFDVVAWPNVFFNAPEGDWDWSKYSGLAVDVYNPSDQAFNVCMRVDNEGGDGMSNCITASTTAMPGAWTTLRADFHHGDFEAFWGMRGIPIVGPVTRSAGLDPSRIVAFQVFLGRPSRPHRLLLDNVRLCGGLEKPLTKLVPFPFIDKFGQYKHDDWPGKVHGEAELAIRAKDEAQSLAAAPSLPGRDAFGGWADGPQLEATGWFRTEQVDGKWWLVTPSGHLFFSLGMDCVGTWQQTFVAEREAWFEWLPEEGSLLARFYGKQDGAHSWADIIGGEGRTFAFYSANLMRKYGEDWPNEWRDTSYKRLRAWGFNTVANWSQQDVLDNSPLPFVVSCGVRGNVNRIDAGGGYWSSMIDVYDPSFTAAADKSLAPNAKRYGKNPLCLGYFVDNEMSWEGVRRGTLASDPGQPCREAFIDMLKEKYGSLEALNEAWKTDAADWDSLREPADKGEVFVADMDAFEYAFARRYFETVRDAIHKYAPHQLYLGCRFSSAPKIAVRAAADVADVISFNLYHESINHERWTGDNGLGKPIVVGEFHFGALDRGMFHTGLVGAEDQQDRAAKYINYVRSVADCPAFVGCHWFQYIDEPTTGRWFDGENYNIGFVTTTDTPYPEMVEAAKRVHGEVYRRRFGLAPASGK